MLESIHPHQVTWSSKCLPWAHRRPCPKTLGLLRGSLCRARSLIKHQRAPEGESLKLPHKTTCILIQQQLFIKKPSPQQLPGLPFCPWVQDKAFPSVPALPSTAPGTGSKAGTALLDPAAILAQAALAGSTTPICCQNPPAGPGAWEESSSAAAARDVSL